MGRFAFYEGLSAAHQRLYRRSDRLGEVVLPDPEPLRPGVAALAAALQSGRRPTVEAGARWLIDRLVVQLAVPPLRVQVLAVRPRDDSGELHGLYSLPTKGTPKLQVWMRTAQRAQIVAFRTFLRTLLHELCHHLDYHLFELAESFHTEGFYRRESSLFRQLLGDAEARPGPAAAPSTPAPSTSAPPAAQSIAPAAPPAPVATEAAPSPPPRRGWARRQPEQLTLQLPTPAAVARPRR